MRCGGAVEAEAQLEATAAEYEKQMSRLGRALRAGFCKRLTPGSVGTTRAHGRYGSSSLEKFALEIGKKGLTI